MPLRIALAFLLTGTVLIATVAAALINRWYVTNNVTSLLEHIGWQGSPGMGRGRMIAELLSDSGFAARLNSSLLISGLVGAAMAGLIGFFGADRIAGPLAALAARVHQLAAGDYRPLSGKGGQSAASPGVLEVAEIDRAVRNLGLQLAEEEALRRRLVEDLAHELRSPLTAVRGYAEGLSDGVFPDPRTAASGMQREIARIDRLITDLRRSTLPSEPGPMVRVDLGELAGTVAAGFMGLSREQGVAIAVETNQVRPGDLCVNGDRDRLGQVLANLLDNALKYTPGGGRVVIAVDAVHGRPEVQLRVIDSGPGIAPADLPHIFDRLYRADNSRARSTGGTGIGLSVVRQIVLNHQGTITAGNLPEGGAVFTVSLPRASSTA